jgi:hypothetical protein
MIKVGQIRLTESLNEIFPDEMVIKRPEIPGNKVEQGLRSETPLESTDDGVPSLDLGAAYPLPTSVSPAEQRKAFNLENGKRFGKSTESV